MKSFLKASELYDVACEACGCDDPNCGLMVNPNCHPDAAVRVKFYKATRSLDVTCSECDSIVARITDLAGPPS